MVHALVTVSPTLSNEFTFGVSQNKIDFFPDCWTCVSRKSTGILMPSSSSVGLFGSPAAGQCRPKSVTFGRRGPQLARPYQNSTLWMVRRLPGKSMTRV